MKLGVIVRICEVFLVHNSQKAVSPAKIIFLALDCFVLFQLVISLSFDKFAALCKSRGEKGSIHETWLRPKIYMGRLNFLAWWVNFWTWVKSDLPPEICVTRKKKGFFFFFMKASKFWDLNVTILNKRRLKCCLKYAWRVNFSKMKRNQDPATLLHSYERYMGVVVLTSVSVTQVRKLHLDQ